MGNYFYQIEFLDGTVKRRVYVSEKLARAVYTAMMHEMCLFNVASVEWGKL